ncbi:MAG TPA: hypothetical protein VG097_00515, partial [Gemmata sp.]|nr:hypothetical protein [Gemmata sp.]
HSLIGNTVRTTPALTSFRVVNPHTSNLTLKKLPVELDTLDRASRRMYALARTQESSATPVVIAI